MSNRLAPPIDYRQIAAQKARQYGVPVDVFLAQIGQESGFSPTAHSGAGADGIAQFIPSTAAQYHVNTHDPVSSLDGAARYDRDLLKRYGSIDRALSAYNSGRPDAYKDPGFAGGQTFNYVRNILARSGSTMRPGALSTADMSQSGVPSRTAPPGGRQQPDRRALMNALIGASSSGDYTGFFGQVKQARQQPLVAQPLPAAVGQSVDAQPLPYKGGSGGFAELLHEGVGGPTHSTGEHIHFASTDPQTELRAIKLAQSLGLTVLENPYTDPVNVSVHAPNSYHKRTFPGRYGGKKLGEAADASGSRDAMLRLYQLLGGK